MLETYLQQDGRSHEYLERAIRRGVMREQTGSTRIAHDDSLQKAAEGGNLS